MMAVQQSHLSHVRGFDLLLDLMVSSRMFEREEVVLVIDEETLFVLASGTCLARVSDLVGMSCTVAESRESATCVNYDGGVS